MDNDVFEENKAKLQILGSIICYQLGEKEKRKSGIFGSAPKTTDIKGGPDEEL